MRVDRCVPTTGERTKIDHNTGFASNATSDYDDSVGLTTPVAWSPSISFSSSRSSSRPSSRSSSRSTSRSSSRSSSRSRRSQMSEMEEELEVINGLMNVKKCTNEGSIIENSDVKENHFMEEKEGIRP